VKNPPQSDVTAQVVLRAASGKRLDRHTAITSANVREYLPSAETVESIAEFFRSAGFKVAPPVGNNFAITAPKRTFEKFFGVNIQRNPDGSVLSIAANGEASLELPLSTLPADVVRLLEAVTFTGRMELH
jgi:hypothetical protein